MKQIDIDDELYQYIASNTQSIGESASTILRRLLNLNGDDNTPVAKNNQNNQTATQAPIDDTPATNDSQEQEVVTPVKQTNANVFNILNKEELAMQKGVVGRFLFILSFSIKI
jgi:negative modulator of initiation of replication